MSAPGKLVRDKIPEIIRADGLEPIVYALAALAGADRDQLEALRAAKAKSNGDFARRLVWSGNRPRGHAP